jgi:hypothetical protein
MSPTVSFACIQLGFQPGAFGKGNTAAKGLWIMHSTCVLSLYSARRIWSNGEYRVKWRWSAQVIYSDGNMY